MDLQLVWFALIGLLWAGYLVLEGFDFGVGALLPVLGKGRDTADTEKRRRVMLTTIGPHWDGNEVWLLTAGGATFAAFPEWYATMFSAFYLAVPRPARRAHRAQHGPGVPRQAGQRRLAPALGLGDHRRLGRRAAPRRASR